MSVSYAGHVRDAIETQRATVAQRIARERADAESTQDPAALTKTRRDQAEADLAYGRIEETLARLGDVRVRNVLSNRDATRYVLEIERPGRPFEALKISGAPLKGEPDTYRIWDAATPRPSTARMSDFDRENYGWILTELVEGRLASGASNLTQVDLPTTLALIDGLKHTVQPAGNKALFHSFTDPALGKLGAAKQSTNQLAGSEQFSERWRSLEPTFTKVQRHLLSQRTWVVHGDAKATQAVVTESGQVVWFDPAGVNAFRAHDPAQLIAESAIANPAEMKVAAERGAQVVGADVADVLAGAGWYRAQYAGWRLYNERMEAVAAAAEGREPAALPGLNAETMFKTAEFALNNALDLGIGSSSGQLPTPRPTGD